jgi:hypothetical protein
MTDEEFAKAHARVVARMWSNNVDDRSRLVLEQAADAMRWARGEIKSLRERLARQALHLERAELDAEAMRRLAFGGQKGGAA